MNKTSLTSSRLGASTRTISPSSKINAAAKLLILLSCTCFLSTILLVAQDIPPDEYFWGSRPFVPEVASTSAIRVQSNLVEVPTVVRDSRGNPVGNLKKDDFLLFDNGKPQTISTFSVLSGPTPIGTGYGSTLIQPRYVALYFDDVNTNTPNLNFAREGAIKFIHNELEPGERVGIFTASGTLTLDFTDDIQLLLDTLARLRLFPRMPNQGPLACPTLGTYQAWVIKHDPSGQTDEFKAAVASTRGCGCRDDAGICARREAELLVGNAERYSMDTFDSITYVIHHLGQMPGRRVLVLASSGFLTLSLNQEQQKVIEAALRASVVINSLSTAGVGRGMSPLAAPLGILADGTGGRYVHDNNDIGAGFHTLAAVPNISYVLGFSPDNLKADGTEHKLKVTLTEPTHLTITARPGYYAPSPELSPSEKRFRKLQQSVMAAANPTEVPIEFTATPETSQTGEFSLRVLVHVDIRKLPFQLLSDRHVERLIFITALFDTNNKFLTGVQGVMDLRLKKATLKRLSAQGIDAKLSIQAPAGSYRVRQVVQEVVAGHISALSRSVQLH